MSLFSWIEDRTGIKSLLHATLFEPIPGGSRWRYVWGSTLVFAFVVQMITGIVLWTAYSPSAQTAWESVYYIQHEMEGGWLLRGIHHFTAQVMIVLIALHVLQVIIDGAYRAPREFNFWTGLILLKIVLLLGLTGYLLPWDQKGYWATKVATNLAIQVPVAGEYLQQLAVGGADYGHHTLTRFFALHAGVLPLAALALTGVHIYFFRRKGIHAVEPDPKRNAYFWPDQVLKDAVACLGVLAVVLFLVLRHRIFEGEGAQLGAELTPPAQPSENYGAARPDWYFLSLFQLLKLVPVQVGAIWIPGGIFAVIALLPIIGRWKLGHRFAVTFIVALLLAAGTLTAMALHHDANDDAYKTAVAQAHAEAARVVELAKAKGIPPTGALTLLEEDAYIQGPRLFKRYCAGCHRWEGTDGQGTTIEEPASGADLAGFASREWLRGFFDPAKITTPHYFGGTALADGDMVDWVNDTAEFDADEKAALENAIIALSAEAGLSSQRAQDAADTARIDTGRTVIATRTGDGGLNCVRCHEFRGEGRAKGPSLTGYGSRAWLVDFIADPAHERFYGENNDRMPSFETKEVLDRRQIGLIADWMRGEWFRPGIDDEGAGVATADGETAGRTSPTSPAVVDEEPTTDATPEPGGPDAEKEDSEATEPAANEGEEATEPESTAGAEAETAEPEDGTEPESAADTKATESADTVTSPKVAPPTVAGDGDASATIDFVAQVKPIFEAHCFGCHGGGRRPKGKFSLADATVAFTPGDSDEAPFVAGKSAASLVYQLITAEDEDERMPPVDDDVPPLDAARIETIRAWIDGGAVWPDGVSLTAPEE